MCEFSNMSKGSSNILYGFINPNNVRIFTYHSPKIVYLGGINPTDQNEKYDVTGCHHTIYGKKVILNGLQINQIHSYPFSIIELPLNAHIKIIL